jgi:aminoglycoside phosphotransferase (APT) family kinase protein
VEDPRPQTFSDPAPAVAALAALAAQVAREFDLGAPTTTEPPRGGGAEVVKLSTSRGSFVVKPVYRVADWELYAVVERALNAQGVRQARLFRTPSGAVVSTTGHCVQEFLTGEMTERPSRRQTDQAMRHLAAYDQALATIPLPGAWPAERTGDLPAERTDARSADAPGDLADTLWTRVVSPSYLVDHLPRLVREHAPCWVDREVVAEALGLLAAAAPGIAALPRQLVHGDIGPDNVLYEGDEVKAIVDFTPFHESTLFSLASALYWFHVHPGRVGSSGGVDVGALRASVAAYDRGRALTSAEHTLVVPMVLREALRRVATPIAGAEEFGGPVPEDATRRRYDAMVEVLALARRRTRVTGGGAEPFRT